jgi:two-component system, cell cycle sensor histidine kinase and response regulator CckA
MSDDKPRKDIDTRPAESEATDTPDAADRARPTRVLIVDDEPSIRTFAEWVLRDAGYAVDAASGGPDALHIVTHEGTFDLFVLDVMMPQMRGDELARQLRERQPDAKVLYVTGCADRLFQEQKVLGDNEALLEKPVTAAELREAVSRLLFEHTHGPEQNS